MHEWNFVVDMFVKDHEKYNGGCQPVTLSIRQGSDMDVSSAISDRLFFLSLFLSVCLSVWSVVGMLVSLWLWARRW